MNNIGIKGNFELRLYDKNKKLIEHVNVDNKITNVVLEEVIKMFNGETTDLNILKHQYLTMSNAETLTELAESTTIKRIDIEIVTPRIRSEATLISVYKLDDTTPGDTTFEIKSLAIRNYINLIEGGNSIMSYTAFRVLPKYITREQGQTLYITRKDKAVSR